MLRIFSRAQVRGAAPWWLVLCGLGVAPSMAQTGALADARPDFPALLWIADQTPAQVGEELARMLGGRVLGRQVAAPDRGAWLLFNAAGRDELHLDWDSAGVREQSARWMRERSDELLVRRPCLCDPATLKRLSDTLADTLTGIAGNLKRPSLEATRERFGKRFQAD